MTIYNRHNEARAYNGMSLLDFFAAQIASITAANSDLTPNDIAERSYEIASAMLRHRLKLYDSDVYDGAAQSVEKK